MFTAQQIESWRRFDIKKKQQQQQKKTWEALFISIYTSYRSELICLTKVIQRHKPISHDVQHDFVGS